MDTKGFGGRTLKKTSYVLTNDPNNAKVSITMEGEVKKFVTIKPSRVRMTGAAGKDDIHQTVRIIPEKAFPFKILEAKSEKEGNIGLDLKHVKTDDGEEYQLVVKNLKDQKTRYFDKVILKTDSEVKPEIQISVYGNILEAPKTTVQ